MVVSTFWYAPAFVKAFSKEIDLRSEVDLAAVLTTNSYTPNQDTHDYFNDVDNQVATANGYTQEDGTGTGEILTTTAITNTLNVITFDSDNPAWTATGAGFTARRLVITDTASGAAATDPVVLWSDFGADETASGGGTFTYAVNGSGWGTITCTDAAGFPA